MKQIIKNRKGEGYIDICVGILALLTVLVLSLNIYSFLTLKQDMDEITEQLIEVAASEGCFGDAFHAREQALKTQYFDFDTAVSADSYYNAAYRRVQLGGTMRVTITAHTKLVGVGIVEIPITATSSRSGISENYWKG